jgi:hypothetical protein
MRRLSQLAALLLVAGGLVISTPGAASASPPQVPCPASVAQPLPSGIYIPPPQYFRQYTLVSATPTFNASDGRFVDNGLDQTIPATFTSSQSRTFSIVVSVGVDREVGDFLKVNVSSQITQSRTTAIGVNVTVNVPPRSTVLGEYGIRAFDVVYDVHTIKKYIGRCYDEGTQRGSTNAPTIAEGWRFTVTSPFGTPTVPCVINPQSCV